MRRRRAIPRSSHRESGHTLWEMLLVLALLGVVAALVAPSLIRERGSRTNGVEETSAMVTSLLARTRLAALERGSAMDVVIDPATARVWAFAVEHGERRLLASEALTLAGGVMLDADADRVRFSFDAAGTASGGPLLVRGVEGMRLVTVDPWSGAADAVAR